MEPRFVFDNHEIDVSSITPEDVRGLSLGKLTEKFGTIGLYTRLIDTLEREGFEDNELVQMSLQLGLTLHANDVRTNGHYTDHLMRVTLRLLEDFKIKDPDLIAAGPLHDVLEDHPRDLVLALTGEKPVERSTARVIGKEILSRMTNSKVADIVSAVTNPDIELGQDKIAVYTEHTNDIVLNSPKGRVLKLADFGDNAAGNHTTIGEKQHKLDEKYVDQYRIHMMGLFLPDSLIVGEERQIALRLLAKGHARALGRLAACSMVGCSH
jgi:hypothetical protein